MRLRLHVLANRGMAVVFMGMPSFANNLRRQWHHTAIPLMAPLAPRALCCAPKAASRDAVQAGTDLCSIEFNTFET